MMDVHAAESYNNSFAMTMICIAVRRFQHATTTITVTEGQDTFAEVCVNLIEGVLSGAVTITLNPVVGSALISS